MMYRPELVPQEIKDSLQRYVEDYVPTGGFLQSVLENDLTGAFARADARNFEVLGHIVGYVYNSVPATCHGSAKIVELWLHRGDT